MYGADYAWILHETIGPPWWKHPQLSDCNQWELEQAVEHLIFVSSHNSIVGGESSISGLVRLYSPNKAPQFRCELIRPRFSPPPKQTNDMFRTELHSMATPQPMSQYAPQTYDAVWAMALALKGAEERWRTGAAAVSGHAKLEGFDYTRHDMAAEFLRQFSQLSFMGISVGRTRRESLEKEI